MSNNPANPQRRSIRLKDYDYSQPGSYFITICTHNHKIIFGNIYLVGAGSKPTRSISSHTNQSSNQNHKYTASEDWRMNLNLYGKIVLNTWNDLVNHNKGIKLGEFIIMPNHIHGIIHFLDPDNEWDDFIPSNLVFLNSEADS